MAVPDFAARRFLFQRRLRLSAKAVVGTVAVLRWRFVEIGSFPGPEVSGAAGEEARSRRRLVDCPKIAENLLSRDPPPFV